MGENGELDTITIHRSRIFKRGQTNSLRNSKDVCLITIEDETGCANLVVFEILFDKYRKEILQSRLLMVEGKLQVEGEVIHLIASCCYNLSKLNFFGYWICITIAKAVRTCLLFKNPFIIKRQSLLFI